MAGPDTFAREIAKIAIKVQENAEREVRKAAMAIEETLVAATPVDTGRARSNWIAQVGSPSGAVVEPRSAEDAIAEARARIGAYRSGQSVYLANNLPYINRLNQGSSAQAPAGFVEQAVASGLTSVRAAKLLK